MKWSIDTERYSSCRLRARVPHNPGFDKSGYYIQWRDNRHTFVTFRRGNQAKWIMVAHTEWTEWECYVALFSLTAELMVFINNTKFVGHRFWKSRCLSESEPSIRCMWGDDHTRLYVHTSKKECMLFWVDAYLLHVNRHVALWGKNKMG